MLVLYGIYNSIQFGSVEDKSTTYIYIHMLQTHMLYFVTHNVIQTLQDDITHLYNGTRN